MSESDGKVSAAYRSLAREEPSASLDAAILSASRGALARPSASRRWAAPVSIAAVLVLAFGVTLRMQQEKPGVESPDMDATRPAQRVAVPAAPPAAAEKFEDKAVAEPSPPMKQAAAPREEARAKKQVAPAAKPDKVEADRALRDEVRVESERKDLKERAAVSELAKESNVASPAAAAAPAPARLKREALAAQAPAGVAADAQAVDEPTRELEAIAKLRVEGRHEEADKALGEFRRKRPDYRIPDAMWERVKPK